MAQYFEGTVDPVEVDRQAVAAGVATAAAANEATQREASQFIVQNGHEVLGGHADVGQPGRMSGNNAP